MRRSVWLCKGLLAAVALAGSASGASLFEIFDDISTLAGAGWTVVNNSSPAGIDSWFQGDPNIFSSQGGAANSYIAANFNAAGFGGNISLWLITPVLTLNDGLQVSFYARTDDPAFLDILQLRMSTNGASANVGATATSVGDFTNLLIASPALNPLQTSWIQYTTTLSGLGGPVSGRLAFRYLVTDTSVNGDYIGIDTFAFTDAVPEPVSFALTGLGLGLTAWLARRRRSESK